MSYPYKNQWLNRYDPSSSCVLTCAAMGLEGRTQNGTISPDDLWLACRQRNWDRLHPDTVDRLAKLYRVGYTIKKDLKFNDIVPGTILYGSWTPLGHCVLVVEVKDSELIYHDPLGLFNGKEYDFGASGERRNADINTLEKTIGKPGEIWGHLPI